MIFGLLKGIIGGVLLFALFLGLLAVAGHSGFGQTIAIVLGGGAFVAFLRFLFG